MFLIDKIIHFFIKKKKTIQKNQPYNFPFDSHMKFNTKEMTFNRVCNDWNAYLFTKAEQKEILLNDLPPLNALLCEAYSKFSEIPYRLIDNLNFIHNNDDFITYVELFYNPAHPYPSERQYPYHINFHTSLSSRFFGSIYYNKDNVVAKAEIISWSDEAPYTITLRLVEGIMSLYRIKKRNLEKHEDVLIYPDEEWYIINNKKDTENLELLQKVLPDIAPKTLAGFRRMKTMNTKNFQKLKEAAENIGVKL